MYSPRVWFTAWQGHLSFAVRFYFIKKVRESQSLCIFYIKEIR